MLEQLTYKKKKNIFLTFSIVHLYILCPEDNFIFCFNNKKNFYQSKTQLCTFIFFKLRNSFGFTHNCLEALTKSYRTFQFI